MMKIVISSNNYWNLYNFRFNFIKDVCKKYDVYLLARKDKFYKKFIHLKCRCVFLKIDPRSTFLFSNLKILANFYLILKKIKPQYYFSFTIKPNIYGAILSKFIKYKSVMNITGLGSTLIEKNMLSKFILLLYKISIKLSYKVFFHNNSDKFFFIKNKIFNKSYDVLPGSGIDLNKFKPSFRKINKTLNFLMISRLIEHKGLYEYLESISDIKKNNQHININFTLVSFGKNYLNNKTNTLLETLKNKKLINFIFDPKNIILIIRKCDCLINPSYREGLSKSILEAMSQSKPVLSSNVPGCKELVKNNYNGFLFKSKSTNSLKKAIYKFIELPLFRKKKMQINSLNKVKNYDEKIVIKKYLDLLNV